MNSMDVKTRWNSTHKMLKSALKIKKSLSQFSKYLKSELNSIEYDQIVETDWTISENITDFLEPFLQCKVFVYTF